MTELDKLRKAKQCIESLAEGLDPFTGRPLPDQEIVNDVRVSRCLFFVSSLLQRQMEKKPAGKNGTKPEFRMSLEERERVEFSSQPICASELARRMNEAAQAEKGKKISYRRITDWLIEAGMMELVENKAGVPCRRPTAQGKQLGISVESRTGQNGLYQVVVYNENAQHFVVDNVDAIVAFAAEKKRAATREPD